MRCTCCNKQLSDVDATAKFAASGAYVDMCQECRGFLPYDLDVKLRPDLEKKNKHRDDPDDGIKFYTEDYDAEEE